MTDIFQNHEILQTIYFEFIEIRQMASQTPTLLDSNNESCESIICLNDKLSFKMNSVGCLLKDSELFFILFAENSQILLNISVIPILLTFMYLVALNLLVNNQLNSSYNSTHHCGT